MRHIQALVYCLVRLDKYEIYINEIIDTRRLASLLSCQVGKISEYIYIYVNEIRHKTLVYCPSAVKNLAYNKFC